MNPRIPDEVADELEDLLELIFQSARYERPSTDAKPALEAFYLKHARPDETIPDAAAFDFCNKAPGFKHSSEWYVYDKCIHCGKGEDANP